MERAHSTLRRQNPEHSSGVLLGQLVPRLSFQLTIRTELKGSLRNIRGAREKNGNLYLVCISSGMPFMSQICDTRGACKLFGMFQLQDHQVDLFLVQFYSQIN